jgi:hypothetical protein
VLALDLGSFIQELLFLLFSGLTALAEAVVGPTYDHLLVPELALSSLYPAISVTGASSSNYLATAARFSTYAVGAIVDPAVALAAVVVGLLYLARSFAARWRATFDSVLPRLVISVVAANFAVPIAGALLALGGSLYPVLAGWDGGAWQQWVHLDGYAGIAFSWDNGAVAFVLSIAEFFLVIGLVLAVGLRDALLAVLLVLLPIFTLLWPFPPLANLARRAWLLFVELVFLPCVLVVPLELAVGSPSAVLLVGFLACALGSPYLLSVAGTHLTAFGFPGASSVVSAGTQRGLSSASAGASGYLSPVAAGARGSGPVASALGGAARAAGSASAPAAAPLAAATLVGHGALHLVRHVRGVAGGGPPTGAGRPPGRGGGAG